VAKILIIEDDLTLLKNVKAWLELENHVIDVVNSGTEAIGHIKIYPYDLIILDLGLPDMSGIQVLETFRSNGGLTPVLILTGKDAITDKAHGLDSGADDYLTKPFHVKELSARIRALLRRQPSVPTNLLTYQDLSLDVQSHKVRRGDREINLSPKEFSLLEFLMRHPEQVFSSETIVDRVWASFSDVSPESVRTYVTRLRSKIDKDDDVSLIQSIYGVGYKLSCEK
jgi:Response regulators consisting of a CheY-like receiver domain and a winged-helix DNA-binding domain